MSVAAVEPWWENAACAGTDPAIFQYGETATGRTSKSIASRKSFRAALELCHACPVRLDCLEDVLSVPPPIGGYPMFQAGFTPEQLDEIARRKGLRGEW